MDTVPNVGVVKAGERPGWGNVGVLGYAVGDGEKSKVV